MYNFLRSKKGFTLVELLVVVAIMGILLAIAIPVYNSTQKNNNIKICRVKSDKLASDTRLWAMDKSFNEDASFTISSDGETGTIASATGLNATDIESKIFDGELPYCPGKGTYTVTLTHNEHKTYSSVSVSCNGGVDGNCHNKP